MILLFNTYISQLEEEYEDEANDDTESGDELDDKNKNENDINDNLSAKDFMNQNCQEIFEFFFQIFNNSIKDDTQFSLIKEILLNSIIICINFY